MYSLRRLAARRVIAGSLIGGEAIGQAMVSLLPAAPAVARFVQGGRSWQAGRMTWTAPAPSPVDGPLTGDDRPILEGYLTWQRVTLLNICAGLSGEQLASRPLPSSNLSLLGLIRHLAKVERTWFRQRAAGQPVPPLYDPALGKDADFNQADAAHAQAELARLQAEWQQADEAVAGLDFGDTFDAGHGDTFSVRMMYVHLIGEYARHNGHADLLREALDGVTGR